MEPALPARAGLRRLFSLVAFAAFAALAALSLPACSRHYTHDQPTTVPQNFVRFEPLPDYPPISWMGSLDEARVRAADEHKPLLIFIRAAWSDPSIIMDSTIWKDGRILAEAPRFIAVKVDLTKYYGAPIPDFLKTYYDVQTVPTTIVISSEGKILARLGKGTSRVKDIAAAMRDAK